VACREHAGVLSGLLLLVGSLLAGCPGGDDSEPAVLFVGLEAGACDSGGRPLFGVVPVRIAAGLNRAAELVEVSLSVNGGAPLEDDAPPFQIDVDTTQQPDGTVELVADAFFEDGTTARATIDVCVDNSPPDLEIIAPADGAPAYVEDAAIAVRVHADDSLGLAGLTARIEVEGRYHEFSCDPPTGPDSVCTLEPQSLGLTLAAGAEIAGTISVLARDATGYEVAASRGVAVRTRLIWELDPTAGSISSTPAAIPSGVIVGTEGGTVIRVESTGVESARWQNPTADDPVTTPIGLSSDGAKVFFGTSRKLGCLTAANLSPCWASMPAGTYLASGPVHSAATNAVLIGQYGTASTPGTLAAYSAADGSLLGTFPISADLGGGVNARPALSSDGLTVYIGSDSGDFRAIDVANPASMNQKWVRSFTARVESLPLVTASRIYVAGFDGYLHALVPGTGAIDDTFAFMREYPFVASVAAAPDGTLYVANLDETFYALDESGAELGSYEIGRSVTRAVVGPAGLVYATSAIGPGPEYGPGELYAFDASLSTLLWSFVPEDSIEFSASPVLGTAPDSRPLVIVANTNGRIYALDATPPSE